VRSCVVRLLHIALKRGSDSWPQKNAMTHRDDDASFAAQQVASDAVHDIPGTCVAMLLL
jgi:hypothetical protein